MEDLEKAAQILMAPPDVVTSEQRHEAEQVFLRLRNTKSPFNLCRQLLETSQNDYLLFEAATLLRVGVIREWRDLNDEDTQQLRQYIVHYVINRPNLRHYVREILVQVVGIMVKRGSVEDNGEDRGRLLTEVEQLVSSGDNTMRMIGCSIISALMQEYAVTVKSTDVGLTWETHFKAKKQFEGTDLRRIFHFTVSLLGEVLNVDGELSDEISALLNKLLIIAETTLTWSFISLHLPKRLMSVFEQDQNPSLRPGQQWKETFLDPSVIQLFFRLYWKVRGDWELGHHALNCLVQLASLNGAVLVNRQVRIKYLRQYLECLFSLLSSVQVSEVEALGISNIFRKLLLFFPPSVLVALPQEMIHQLIENLTALTCKFAQGAAQEEMVDHEDQLFMEAFEQMLQSWACILQETTGWDNSEVKQSATLIFDTYLKCHLAPPEGSRLSVDAGDDIADAVQSDRLAFKEQLLMIGLCGRQVPEHSVPLLTQLLEERVGRLRTQLAHIHTNNLTIGDNSQLDQLFEDIHWLLLIAGHVTTMDNEGETALIPSEMVTYSMSAAPNVNLEATLQLLAAPAQMPQDIPNSASGDPLIRLMSAVLRLCETESQALKANMGHLLSPEVSSSLMWFLRRFCLSYLLPYESFYAELSVALTSAFGRDSEGGCWTLNYLLSTVEQTLRLRSAEPGMVEDTVNLLVTMVDSKERGAHIVKSDGLMELVKLQHSGRLASISSAAQRGLMQGLVMCAAAISDTEARTQYWTHVLDPPIAAFKHLVTAESFAKQYLEEEPRKQVLLHIDNIIGAMQGCLMPTAQCLFTRLVGILGDCVRLVDLYHNYATVVEAVLELYVECGRRLLCYLTPNASKQLFEASVLLVSAYARHNIGRRTVDASGEEDQWRDIQLLMELLTSLLSKDFIDLAPSGHGEDERVAAADVCLFGLNIIMPLMSRDLLRLPTLCSQYFKMITFIAEIYPCKVCQLPEELMKNLLASIELGLTSFGPDVGTLSFDFLVVLGSYVHKNCGPETPVRQGLRPFLKLVLDLILSQQINSDLLQAASASLYTLICCYQVEYQELVESLLQSQGDPTTSQRLAEAFTQLTANIELTADRINRIKFRDSFEKFIAKVRGFLLVK
ncbi:exportin-4-like isoform X2 [Oratosquilla oratoria]|uniref:exportin-4-like isoform X2 n=1 Tax=Oratosquilla oratoria TaxID=337810 RepID=UPI003F75C7E9